MTWFKVDDSFYDHPKVFDAPDSALALWTRAGCWSARNLTDGFVPAKLPARLCDDPDTAVGDLVDRGLWQRTKGGYRFHDWSIYQPSAEEVRALRTKRAEAGRKGGLASGKTRSNRGSKNEASASGVAKQNGTPTRPDLEGSKEPSTPGKKHRGRPKVSELPRPDVDELCEHLASKVAENGSTRPKINKQWRDAARLLMDKDGKTFDQVMRAIDWSQGNSFWCSNVMSMPTLRDQYDRLRLAAEHEKKQKQGSSEPPRVVASDDARCEVHPRQLAGHCALCAADAKGRAA